MIFCYFFVAKMLFSKQVYKHTIIIRPNKSNVYLYLKVSLRVMGHKRSITSPESAD